MDKKGIFTYLAITFVLAYAAQAFVILAGLSFPFMYVLLAVPLVSAWAASRLSPAGDYPRGGLWPIPKLPAIRIALVIPAIFVVAHVVNTILGVSRPDWRVGELMARLPSPHELQIPPGIIPVLPLIFLGAGFVLSLVLGPTLYAVLMVGNEYGWRGYLLPRLMPLGRWTAYPVVGLLWGLSYAPLVLWAGGGAGPRMAHLLMGLAAALVASAVLGEVWRRSRHLGLTAVCSGCLVCQASTIWDFLFPSATTRFPWGGSTGVVSVLIWVAVAFMPDLFFGSLGTSVQPTEETGPEDGSNAG